MNRHHETVPLLQQEEPVSRRDNRLLHLYNNNNSTVVAKRMFIFMLPFLIMGTTIILYSLRVYEKHDSTLDLDLNPFNGITLEGLKSGLNQCQTIAKKSEYFNKKRKQEDQFNNEQENIEQARKRNPRVTTADDDDHTNRSTFSITNATLINQGRLFHNATIIVKHGLVHAVYAEPFSKVAYNELDPTSKIIDVKGRYVSAGLVDMHSHLGVDSWPEMWATDDTNEMSTTPVTSFVRSIDGFNPFDAAIDIVNSGGVTTTLILPGSGNLIGGEAYLIKTRRVPGNSVQDMLLDQTMDKDDYHWRYIKMACGENPKRVYGRKGLMPSTRLGSGFKFREAFESARKLVEAQDDWCVNAQYAVEEFGSEEEASEYISTRFPTLTTWDTLSEVLRGHIRIHNHCYETHDLEMMIRHSKEFNFRISAFHHALEAHKIVNVLKRENISVALFADHWGYKKEAYGSSVHGPQILAEAGVRVAFKSDHPVLNSQHLIFEAAKAHQYGLDTETSLKSVTSTPADILGQGKRIGRIQSGYDADIVIWNRHPLEVGAHPLKVYVDGIETFSHSLADAGLSRTFDPSESEFFYNDEKRENIKHREDKQSSSVLESDYLEQQEEFIHKPNYILANLTLIYADENTTLNGDELVVVVKSSVVDCIGTYEECQVDHRIHRNQPVYHIFDMDGGIVCPGLIAVHSKLGMEEIPSESSTRDGVARQFDPQSGGPRAVDGLRVWKDGSLELQAAFKAGILTAVSIPRTRGVVGGQSVAFKIGENSIKTAVLKQVTGVTVRIGDDFKDDNESSSIGLQVSLVRRLLVEQVPNVVQSLLHKAHTFTDTESPFYMVVCGKITLYVEVHEANDIYKVIQIKRHIESMVRKAIPKRRIKKLPKIKMTIVGGAESWVIASDLASEGINVILRPSRCTPATWETRRCRIPSTYQSTVETLKRAGVKVALASEDDNLIRGLLFEAGWSYADSNDPDRPSEMESMSKSDAIGLVTWDAADAAGLHSENEFAGGRITVGKLASFVAFDKDPLQFGHSIRIIADGKHVQTSPQQI